jgi:uncharacterized protein YjbI with pentapeptide repeats
LETLLLGQRFNDAYRSAALISLARPTREAKGLALDEAWASFDAAAKALGATSPRLAHLLKESCTAGVGLNLDGIVLVDADLNGCKLKGSSLQNAYVRGRADGADLSRCDLREAVLANLRMKGATLLESNLRGTLVKPKAFEDVNLEAANWWDAWQRTFDLQTTNRIKSIVYDETFYQGSSQLQAKYPHFVERAR